MRLSRNELAALTRIEVMQDNATRPSTYDIDLVCAALRRLAAPGPVVEERLWLWRNGDHYLAFSHLYPCYTPGGDPMVLGEPFGWAKFVPSHDRALTAALERKDHE